MNTIVNKNMSIDKCKQRYLIPECEYDYDHPKVVQYTQYFFDRAAKENVFGNINKEIQKNANAETAEKIANIWYVFSKYVPSFISKAVSLTEDPEQQHHLIQVAYDELGGRDKNLLHSKLFLDALSAADIRFDTEIVNLNISRILSSMTKALEKTRSQSGIIGLLLSFEIIAETNIETLFDGLGYTDDKRQILSDSLFFKIHRADEIEHIRHSVANFLRFSNQEEQIAEAEEFFDAGIQFWKAFWDEIAKHIGQK